jgi:hypothetical protein
MNEMTVQAAMVNQLLDVIPLELVETICQPLALRDR